MLVTKPAGVCTVVLLRPLAEEEEKAEPNKTKEYKRATYGPTDNWGHVLGFGCGSRRLKMVSLSSRPKYGQYLRMAVLTWRGNG
jgi:hypothetical protein